MALFKKKTVPDELPELALDDAESQDKEVDDFLKGEESKKPSAPAEPAKTETVAAEESKPAAEDKSAEASEAKEPAEKEPEAAAETEADSEDEAEETETSSEEDSSSEEDKSFFGDLKNDLNEGITNSDQLEKWYRKKFEEGDVIKDMKHYWEDKKTESIFKIFGKSLQEKISSKISELQNLEKEWQKTYFDMVEKEEQIREHESELKDLLSEFVRVFKNNPKFSNPKHTPVPAKSAVKKSAGHHKNRRVSGSKAKKKRVKNEKRKKAD